MTFMPVCDAIAQHSRKHAIMSGACSALVQRTDRKMTIVVYPSIDLDTAGPKLAFGPTRHAND